MNVRDNILSGEYAGVIALAGDIGISMAGDPGLSAIFDTEPARIARGWGTYIEPAWRGFGISQRIWKFTTQALKDLGFDWSTGEALASNRHAMESFKKFGGERITIGYRLKLR